LCERAKDLPTPRGQNGAASEAATNRDAPLTTNPIIVPAQATFARLWANPCARDRFNFVQTTVGGGFEAFFAFCDSGAATVLERLCRNGPREGSWDGTGEGVFKLTSPKGFCGFGTFFMTFRRL